MATPKQHSIEYKLHNPSCEEPLFDREHYSVKWVTVENMFSPKNRILSVTQTTSGYDFFKRLNNLDTGIEFRERIGFHTLLSNFEQISKVIKENEADMIGEFQNSFNQLTEDVREIERICRKVAKSQAEEGIISFHLMPFLYNKNDKIEVAINGSKHAAILITLPDVISGLSGVFMRFRYRVVDMIEKMKWSIREEYIPYYNQTKIIADLPVMPLAQEREEYFKLRGKQSMELGSKPYFKFANKYQVLHVQDMMFYSVVKGHEQNRPSRAVIDCVNVNKLNEKIYTDYRKMLMLRGGDDMVVTEDDAMFALSFLIAYIPSMRVWVVVNTEDIGEIQFSETAITDLVLHDKTKHIVKALVRNASKGFADIIQGKSGGTIICLEGRPGTGKTLTAEAVAEHLHKPLITISSGSLGTKAEDIEKNLKKELAIAEQWDAVALIDEADVFMAKRQSNDIEHNGVVSVFLRSLEYYRGVMFVTTNRKGEMDEAFKSRILLTIRYNDLCQSDRATIWFNLLRNANIKANHKVLSAYPINGRQIKNAIRISEGIDEEYFPKNSNDQTSRIMDILNHTHKNDLSICRKAYLSFKRMWA